MNLRIFGFHGVSFANPGRRAAAFVTLLLASCACSNAVALEWAEESREPWSGDYDSGYEDGFRAGRSDSMEESRDYRRGGIPTRPIRENPWISAPQPGIRSEQDNPWANAQRFRPDPLQRDFPTAPPRERRSRSYADDLQDDYWSRQPAYRGSPWGTGYGYQQYDVYRPALPYGAPVFPSIPGSYGIYGQYPYWGTYPGYIGYPGLPGYSGYPAIGSPFGLGWPGGLLWH
jgi:hypothetical protein